jgi:hypothetical protein
MNVSGLHRDPDLLYIDRYPIFLINIQRIDEQKIVKSIRSNDLKNQAILMKPKERTEI